MKHEQLNKFDAEKLFKQYQPMFKSLDVNNINYCLVGGVAVIAHAIANNYDKYRATIDADLVLPKSYTNKDFAENYIDAYAQNDEQTKTIAIALVGDEDLDKLNDKDNKYANISFIGAEKELDGIETPDFDVCRSLNGLSLEDISIEKLNILGFEVSVASIEDLITMKQKTIELYGPDPQTNPRFQDFIDLKILKDIKELNKH